MTTEVFRLASASKILIHWCGDSRACAGSKGLPDLVLVGTHHAIFRELKQDSQSAVRPGQSTWKWALRGAGIDSGTWYACDIESGQVEREIKALNKSFAHNPRKSFLSP